MASKILITNAHSPIGQAIYSAFQNSSYAVLAPAVGTFDWENPEALECYLRDQQVDVVINTTGWRERPGLEQQQLLVQAARTLAEAARRVDCVVIHLSSYRVFGGENKSSYDEDDAPLPLGEAGRAFLAAEQAIVGGPSRHICLRVSWVIDIIGESVFYRLLRDLTSEGPVLEVTHQRRGSPISTYEIGRVILAMVHQILCGADNWGVFHLGSSDPCSSAEFAEVVADILEREGQLRRQWCVEALTEEQLEEQSEPDSAALTVHRCRDNFGYQVRSWRQGLTGLVRAWLAQQQAGEQPPTHKQSLTE